MTKIFQVLVNDNPYHVYDIDGKEHEGYNDTSKTWWIYYSEPMPDGLMPPLDSEFWKPFHVSINRRLWNITFEQRNYTKVKWDELNFRNNTSVKMFCNGRLVYEFGTTGTDHGLAFAFGKVQYLMVVLSEHPFNFFEPETENGRKIYWYGLPAFVVSRKDDHEIRIRPDYEDGLNKEEWWYELERRESTISANKSDEHKEDEDIDKEYRDDARRSEMINWGDALSDGHINWFRK